MRLHRVEPAHEQVEQSVPHRSLARRSGQRRLIQHHAEPPQQRHLAGKPRPHPAQIQIRVTRGIHQGKPGPAHLGSLTEGRGDQCVVEILVVHNVNVSGNRAGFNPSRAGSLIPAQAAPMTLPDMIRPRRERNSSMTPPANPDKQPHMRFR